MNQQISREAIRFIKNQEGLRLKPYYCIAGKLTIGYGDTSNVTPNMVITEQEADQRLRLRLDDIVKKLSPYIKIKLNPHQMGAIVDLAYNAGVYAVQKSTLLKLVNKSDFNGAANEFLKWDKYTDPKTGVVKVHPVLKRRRELARNLFLKPYKEGE